MPTKIHNLPAVARVSADAFAEHLAHLIKTNGTVTMKIGPEEAMIMLGCNTGNRKILKRFVKMYAEQMSNGKWMLNGEPIIFSREGILNDGQHRLEAVRLSGATITTDVRFGVERASFRVTDLGAKRTAGAVLGIDGVPNASIVASALRLLFCHDAGDNSFGYALPNNETFDLYNACPHFQDSVSLGVSVHGSFKLITPSILSFCHYVFARIDRAAADTFYELLRNGTGTGVHPVDLLRRLLINQPPQQRFTKRFVIACLIKTWNFYRRNETRKDIRWRTSGPTAEDFPAAI